MTTARSATRRTTALAAATSAATGGKRFYSAEDDIRVTLPDGAVAIIGREPRELPQRFWRPATRAGALIHGGLTAEELAGPVGAAETDPHTRADRILNAVLAAVRAPEDAQGFEDAFNTNGTPNVRWIETHIGFSIDAAERDMAWARAQTVLDEEESKLQAEKEAAGHDESPDQIEANKVKLAQKGGEFAVE